MPQSAGDRVPWVDFFLDFALVCFPLLALMTGFHSLTATVNAVGSAVILLGALAIKFGARNSRPEKRKPKFEGSSTPKAKQLSYISIFRSSLMVMTCIAILAVDFHVFPRFYAKVETFGSSLVNNQCQKRPSLIRSRWISGSVSSSLVQVLSRGGGPASPDPASRMIC